jgi:hypothetical protein
VRFLAKKILKGKFSFFEKAKTSRVMDKISFWKEKL